MQLDKFTDYGLRLLIHLATFAPDRVSTRTVAKRFALSEHHLAKVATVLVREGFVISERGRGGGLQLARPADQISIGAVVRALTRDTAVAECFGTGHCDCAILPLCGLRGPLQAAQEAFYRALDPHTLAAVAQNRAGLKALLSA
jgi:Rrf2 family nitric oxide-sensitive transcriptional repressor